jgi:hypothetical protein
MNQVTRKASTGLQADQARGGGCTFPQVTDGIIASSAEQRCSPTITLARAEGVHNSCHHYGLLAMCAPPGRPLCRARCCQMQAACPLLRGRPQLPQAQADTVEVLAPEGWIAGVEVVEEQGVAATVGVAEDRPGATVAR